MRHPVASSFLLSLALVGSPAVASEPLIPADPGSDEEAAAEVPSAESPEARLLPFLAESAREQGVELPLPFGVGTNFLYLQRDLEVSSVKVALRGENLREVDDYLAVDVRTHTYNAMARFDAWVLPFLNVFGLLGYTATTSDVDLTASVPRLGETSITGSGTSQGLTYGGGGTLAGGYGSFFASVDAIYAIADIDTLDEKINALVLMTRTGWNGKIADVPSRLWVGATYWDTERRVQGSVPTPQGELSFEVLQGPRHPWNANVGGQVEFSDHWYGVADLGFNFDDMLAVTASVGYRF